MSKATRRTANPAGSGVEVDEHTPRLRLKDDAPVSGYVDGAWWPHSGDLPSELPDLVAALRIRVGPVARVRYGLSEWGAAPRKISVDGRVVRMDGYHRQPPHTIGVSGVQGSEIVLLVVPAQTEADRAHTIVMAAATTADASSVDSLLEASGRVY